MGNLINKFLDIFLTKKNLKVVFFILFFILFIVIIISIKMLIKHELCFTDLIAPYIIGVSALMASTVAMLNMRTNELNKILENNRKDISEIHNLIVILGFIISKMKQYKKIIYLEKKVELLELSEYEKLLGKYEEFFSNKTLMYYSTIYGEKNTFDKLYKIENDLFFVKMYTDEEIKYMKSINKKICFLEKRNYIKKHIDNLILNTENLREILHDISKNIRDNQNNLISIESYS